ncbi:MAG: CRISPR-associated endonuclease Cas2 [Spirochaetaceae bacterium]|nr:CRISPR-associated endonuclease Cas2 [Spirochaetaceae bacterium]
MRIIVFFDLPTETLEDKREYRKFRKMLIENGFVMMQESVYCRMLLTPGAGRSVISTIRKNRPKKGVAQVLTVTEKQFAAMEFISGESKMDVISDDKRLVVL